MKFWGLLMYRLKDEEEALQAGVEECLYSGSLCFVEWPLKAPLIFPPDTVQVFLETIGDTARKISINLPVKFIFNS